MLTVVFQANQGTLDPHFGHHAGDAVNLVGDAIRDALDPTIADLTAAPREER